MELSITINKRHINLIIELIEVYKSNNIEYHNFVNRLDKIIDSFDNPPKQWHEDMKSLWINLEEINAVLLDESNNQTINNYNDSISEYINNLSDLVKNFEN